MNEHLKYLVECLNRPPFSKKFTLFSFDSLDSGVLLQIVNDVLTEISPDDKMDLREEAPEQTVYRMLSLLHVLKYKPEVDASAFRQGLMSGEKPIVYPLLHWLLKRTPDLKKRAYLAKYLMRIDVPADVMQDDTVAEVFQQYETALQEFKEVHKVVEHNNSSSFFVGEIRKDISSMEEEKEKLQRRIERLEKKASSIPRSEKLLVAAQRLRVERDREVELGESLREQQSQVLHLQYKIDKLSHQLKDLQVAEVGLSAKVVMEKLEEENRLNRSLAQDVLPQKVAAQKKICRDLDLVLSDPATSEADLVKIKEQIDDALAEATSLMEKHMPSNDPIQAKLTLFRQQASIIANKRETAQNEYRAAMEELSQAEGELKTKRQQLQELGGEVLKEEEFKRYVSKLRTLNTTYKRKKAELSAIQAECGVLSRTEAILESRREKVHQMYSDLEEKEGVSGYKDAQENLEKVSSVKEDLDEKKGKSLMDMAAGVEQLNEKIASKKASLAPIIRELRPLREQNQELSADHAEKKAAYENLVASFESRRSQLEHEVRVFREQCLQEESRYHYLQAMKKSTLIQQQRIANEMKIYTAGESSRQKTLRDQYTRKIQEQENIGRALKDKKKVLVETHPHAVKQVKMWDDLKKLLECKRECFVQSQIHKAQAAAAQQAILSQENRLVLS